MDEMPYIDKKGRIYKYGEFFPIELSPHAYNETLAQEFLPITKEEATKFGYDWRDQEKKDLAITLSANKIPDDIKNVDEKILEEMKKARNVVSVALEERARAGISVRKPLATFGTATVLDDEFILLIKDEVNVKEIKIGQKENKLDINITPELKNEGMTRELVRSIQELRKKSGFNPRDKINLEIETNEAGEKFIKNS